MVIEKLLINGVLCNSIDNSTIQVTNPFNGEVVGSVPNGTKEDVDIVLSAAKEAHKKWAALTYAKRAEYVDELADILQQHREELALLLSAEHGKVMSEALGEVDGAVNFLRFAAHSAKRLEGEVVTSHYTNEHAFISRVSYGVVVGIVAWNFPLALAARKLGNALVCGNTMIIKPPSETPITVMRYARLISEKSSIPKGVINFITGSGEVVGNALVRNNITRLVTLTGSTDAGIEVFKAAAENVVDIRLELGGKAPFIVMQDANIKKAAQCAAVARYSNCGQICTCNERMYIHADVYDEFINRYKEYSEQQVVGDPSDPQSTIGPKVSSIEVDKLNKMKRQAIEQGAKVLFDLTPDKMPNDKGNWYYPTLLEVPSNDNILMQVEIFGPMVGVMKINSIEEAIEHANDCEYGLSAYLFSNDIRNIMKATNELEFGELYINRENGELINGFHNGYKKSGLGGEDGKHGLEGYLQKKMVYVNYNV